MSQEVIDDEITMMKPSERKYKELTLAKKIEVIRFLDSGNSERKTADHFKVSKGTVNNIKRKKEEYLNSIHVGNNPGGRFRRVRKTENEDINNNVWNWFKKCRNSDIPISGPMIKQAALIYAKKVGNDNFQASNGWLQAFKKRHQLSFKSLPAESQEQSVAGINGRVSGTIGMSRNNNNEIEFDEKEHDEFGSSTVKFEQDENEEEGRLSAIQHCIATITVPPSECGDQMDRNHHFGHKSAVGSSKHILTARQDSTDVPELARYSPNSLGTNPPESAAKNSDDEFGDYVAQQLKLLRSQENKERLKNEIRKSIFLISCDDQNEFNQNNGAVNVHNQVNAVESHGELHDITDSNVTHGPSLPSG